MLNNSTYFLSKKNTDRNKVSSYALESFSHMVSKSEDICMPMKALIKGPISGSIGVHKKDVNTVNIWKFTCAGNDWKKKKNTEYLTF